MASIFHRLQRKLVNQNIVIDIPNSISVSAFSDGTQKLCLGFLWFSTEVVDTLDTCLILKRMKSLTNKLFPHIQSVIFMKKPCHSIFRLRFVLIWVRLSLSAIITTICQQRIQGKSGTSYI